VIASHLAERPLANPLEPAHHQPRWAIPGAITERWPDVFSWLSAGHTLSDLPIDHAVAPTATKGGPSAGTERLKAFLRDDLEAYGADRNDPDRDVSSRLSPYLHWGHLGPHEVFDRLMENEGWLGHLPARATGMREGWWGVSPAAERFLDEFITWRELGYNMAARRPDDYTAFESLPGWAQQTLGRHDDDPRDPCYTLDIMERAGTYDPL
jgi:deoxyribodipyrimidine photo-lyase